MALQSLKPALVAFVAVVTFGAPVASIAGASTAARVTICYNRTNGVVHYAPSGRCAPSQTAVVVGRGIAGARGLQGLTGVRGAVGTAGADGADGAGGADGADGAGGADGADGTDGTDGTLGATGPQGATGPTGVSAFHRVVSSVGSTVGTSTITASCSAGEVVTGGGFAESNATISASGPNGAGDGWTVSYWAASGPVSVTANAICVAGTSS